MELDPDIKLLPIKEISDLSLFSFKPDTKHQINKLYHWIFYSINSGTITLFIGKESLYLEAGDCIILPNGEQHSFATSQKETTQVTMITFDSFTGYSPLDPLNKQILHLSEHQKHLVRAIFYRAALVYPQMSENAFNLRQLIRDADPIDEQILYLHFSELVYSMIQDHRRLTAKKEHVSPKIHKHDLISQIMAYMEENLDKNITIEEFANHFYISASHIKKVFKEYTGYSMINYYKILKIEKAKELILSNEKSFTEIGLELGYDSIHHFSNTFKKYTGLSPTKYKQSKEAVDQKMNELS
ncbi:helix-turn-helix domain-containing protein [Enterococcus sp. 669A]|uniref:Helix-turn-helix domain-containing protein n=1 Tax=Candidatus Enterococcus moelleringii TaxID=2815325 RepID=A0ABS3L543_9ENTE|nr:helix-turn-helix domain-containing protein [Enterococcus sp. 669A]MBO1304736.1 helix-turn-helix domain-containing protein [Enterococcus sp. 669A]